MSKDSIDYEVKTLLKELEGELFVIDVDEFEVSYLMSDIKSVSLVENGKTKVVIMKFADGTEEKAVLDEQDVFSLEQGISICITKKVLSEYVSNGSSIYNKLVKRGLKVYNSELKEKEKEKKRLDEAKEKERRFAAKKRLKKEKREAKEREKQIEIYKEAYLRAMAEQKNN